MLTNLNLNPKKNGQKWTFFGMLADCNWDLEALLMKLNKNQQIKTFCCCVHWQVCLHGLNLLMPLMNAELLRFPMLCRHYYKLITFACEICPEKMLTIPADMLANLFASLQLGMNSFGSDVAALCFEFIQVQFLRFLFDFHCVQLNSLR